MLRWGLIPSWAKEAGIGARMINARAETLADKPAFRAAFRARRCLIAADGFYEWAACGQGPKQPYRIVLRAGGCFAFAGLWESWRDPAQPGQAAVESCTIITTTANCTLQPIHARMPVILDPADFGRWLDPRTAAADLRALLRPLPDETLTAYPVSTRVNSVANDDLDLLRPLDAAAAGAGAPGPAQGQLF
jgi:putative SOS response-associated peptidase YedK